MLPAVQRQRVIDRGDGVPASRVSLVNKRNGGAKRQSRANAQWLATERIVVPVLRARIRISAVLDPVSHLVEEARRECRLQGRRPDEVAKTTRVGPLNVGNGQTSFASLPVMSVIPRPRHLLLWR